LLDSVPCLGTTTTERCGMCCNCLWLQEKRLIARELGTFGPSERGVR